MARRKRRLKHSSITGPIELNVMPFIDIFSLLTTFLLYVAVFTHIGIVEVQVPFLSNNNTDKDKDKPERVISVHVMIDNSSLKVESFFLIPPDNKKNKTFEMSKKGLRQMHNYLIKLRRDHPATDKLSLFPDDEVEYDALIQIIDTVKFLKEGEPPIGDDVKADADGNSNSLNALYPKVIIGNILY